MVEAGEHLDEIDRILVRELVADGRATLAHLAATAGLSVSAVQSRVRRLESRGVGTGYTARINPEAIGKMLSAFVAITPLDPSQPDDAPARLEHIPAIVFAATDPDRGECPHPKHDNLTDFLLRTRNHAGIVPASGAAGRKKCVKIVL